MAKYMVTGCIGFIGSHLSRRLLEDGHVVYGVDACYTGQVAHLDELCQFENFQFHRDNVSTTSPSFEYEATPLDGIWHLASPASPVDYMRLAWETIRANTEGTRRMTTHAARHRCPVLFTSTSEIYGSPAEHPQKETYWGHVNPVGPRSVYDEAKRLGETIMLTHHTWTKLPVRIARIFNTYGPGMRPNDGRVVSNFIVQALQNKPLTMYGDGSQTRSLCYVSDMVEGLLALWHHGDSMPCNLGNPHEVTMLELAQLIIELTNSRSQITFHPLPVDDPPRRCPDISKAQNLLSWNPRVVLRDGLLFTIKHLDGLLSKGVN